jgi:GT2 family glycosyltransferase
MKGLSVIIPSYNTKDMTLACISSLASALDATSLHFEIIIVDNASTDGSASSLTTLKTRNIIPILNSNNVGYGRANNQGITIAKYDYVLFLNSDVLMDRTIDFAKLIDFLDRNTEVGVLTVDVRLASNQIDPASHRGFPTPWRSFCYFTGLEKATARLPVLNRVFGGYHLTHLDRQSIHEIDSPTGAFYLTRKTILDDVGGFDEDYFMYGEDLDLSYRIKNKGFKILYYPQYSVTHYKSTSGLKRKNDTKIQSRTKGYFYDSMEIFYRKHYEKVYPKLLNNIIYGAIKMKARV